MFTESHDTFIQKLDTCNQQVSSEDHLIILDLPSFWWSRILRVSMGSRTTGTISRSLKDTVMNLIHKCCCSSLSIEFLDMSLCRCFHHSRSIGIWIMSEEVVLNMVNTTRSPCLLTVVQKASALRHHRTT